MASNTIGSENIPAALSAPRQSGGSQLERTTAALLASDPRAGLAAAFKLAVAYFGRTEPASEQCEANR